MANFLGNLGAALQGQQNYQTWETQQEQAKLRIENEKENLARIKELEKQEKEDRARQPEIAQGQLDYWNKRAGLGLPPPPPSAQPPAPGQASVPMVQPNAQYGQRPIGPDNGLPQLPQGGPPPMPPQGLIPPPPGGGAPMPQGGPPMPPQQGQPQGQQMPPQGPQGGPQAQPAGQQPMPPYRTVQGAQQQPQMGMQSIAPVPQQQQPIPAPNSMTLEDVARFVKERNVKDPITALKIFEGLVPYANNETKQQLAQAKLEIQQHQQQAALAEKYYALDKAAEQKGLTREQQLKIEEDKLDLRRTLGMMGLAISQQNANTRSAGASAKAGGNQDADAIEAATWNSLLKSEMPPRNGGMYAAVMKNYGQIARANNISIQELVSASADAKTKFAAKRGLEQRAQNTTRAENQILEEIPLAEQAIKELNISSIPAFQKAGLAGLRALGDGRVTTLDNSLTTIFNEFEGIRTGNPSALHVADIMNAQHDIENARTEETLKAAIKNMRGTIDRAKIAIAKTRQETLDDINNSFKKPKPGAASAAPALPAGWSVKVN